jgi:hypothetical protein
MDRRNFIGFTATGLGTALSSRLGTASPQRKTDAQGLSATVGGTDIYQLTSRYSDESARAQFTSSGPSPELPPHIYLHFDTKAKRFITPQDIEPDLTPGKYQLNAELTAFNMSQTTRQQFRQIDQNKDLQLTLNVAAPQSGDESDTLSWLFMNAIDIFGNKSDVQQRLTKFSENNKLTASLKPISRIMIPQGEVDLQVVALGQEKVGGWKKLFTILSKISATPIFASFGLPALVPEVLQFVNQSLNVMAANEKLVEIWRTKRLPFGILKDTDAEFKLKKGYWVIVDREYALNNRMLQNHKVDEYGQSLSLVRSDNQPVDANYLVTNLKLTQGK